MFSVRRSDIHGRGCFAEKRLRPGTEFVVPSYPRTGPESRHDVWVEGVPYLFYHPFMFLNHSDEPNCELFFEDGFKLYVLKNVQPGTELTIHYGEDWSG